MIISNVQIAEMVAARGYDYAKALDDIDAGRSPEDEEQVITEKEVDEMVDAICGGFDCENEANAQIEEDEKEHIRKIYESQDMI